jgi:hypothetical protein
LVAPAGLEVTAQVRVTVPAKPFVELTVTVDVPGEPGDNANGVADIE